MGSYSHPNGSDFIILGLTELSERVWVLDHINDLRALVLPRAAKPPLYSY